MGDFLHRTTKRFYRSTSPSDLPVPIADCISQPDLSAVEGVPVRYWLIAGDVVSEMSPAEKGVVDQATLDAARDSSIQQIDEVEDTLRQIVKMMISELNILRSLHGLPDRTLAQVKTQLRGGYGS